MFDVEEGTVAVADWLPSGALMALCVGFGTPRGFRLPTKVEELIPLKDSQPSVSQ